MLLDLVKKNRSYRRFYEEERVSPETLHSLAELARLTPSSGNSQALKFILSQTPEKNEIIFRTLGWAGYLADWDGPEPGERPAAYIVILCDNNLGKNKQIDVGIAAQTILLGAAEQGLGGCMVYNVRRSELMQELHLEAQHYSLELVVALGRPKETVLLEPLGENGDIRYYRDENGVHHVPKRDLQDLILE